MKRETTKAWMTPSQGLAGIAMTCLTVIILTGFAVYMRDAFGFRHLNTYIFLMFLAVGIYVYIRIRITYRYFFFDDELVVEKLFGKKRRAIITVPVGQMMQIQPLSDFGPSLFELKSVHQMFTRRRNAFCVTYENEKIIHELWFNPSPELVGQIQDAIRRHKNRNGENP